MSGLDEAGVRFQVSRWLVVGVLGFSLILSLASGAASSVPEVQGDLLFSQNPALSGTMEGEGKGEVQVLPGPGLEVEGQGKRVVVEEYRLESLLIDPPMMPPNELQQGESDQNDFIFQDAAFSLLTVEDDFQSLMRVQEGDSTMSFTTGHVEASLVAVKDASLVVDEDWAKNQDRGDEWSFTYVAEGDRFPLEVESVHASGAPSLYLWDAEFVVEEGGERQTFTAGAYQEEVTPGTYRYVEVYYIVRMDEGTMDATGEHRAWMQDPVIDLDGTISSAKAQGRLDYKGDTHQIDGVPFSAEGPVRLWPEPHGDPVPPEQGSDRPGFYRTFDHVYGSSRTTMTGDGSVVISFTGTPVHKSGSGVPPVAATVGIIGIVGAAVALTPQGKWALVGALAPLYAKTQRDRLLESPQRERLMEAIQANPGVHISRLREIAELSWGTTVYHLRLMEKNELVTSVPRAGQRHFFIKTPGVDAARVRGAVSAIVGQETAHRVAFAVLNMPGASQKSLAEHLGVSSRVVAHHIARLVKADLVTKKRDGGFIRCYPTSELGDALAILDTGEVPSMAVSSGHQESQVPVVQA